MKKTVISIAAALGILTPFVVYAMDPIPFPIPCTTPDGKPGHHATPGSPCIPDYQPPEDDPDPGPEGCEEPGICELTNFILTPPNGCPLLEDEEGDLTCSDTPSVPVCCNTPGDDRGYENIASCAEKTGSRCPRSHRFEVELCYPPGGAAILPEGRLPNADGSCDEDETPVKNLFGETVACGSESLVCE